MNRKKLEISLGLSIFFVAYLVVLFVFTKTFHTSFWTSFIFVMLAFVFLTFATFFVSSEKRKKQVVGMPVNVLTIMYFVVELVMGTTFMFFDVSFPAVFVPQFLFFVLFVLCFIPAVLGENNYKDEIANNEPKEQEPTKEPTQEPTQEVEKTDDDVK